MEIPFKGFPVVFARLRGRNGCVREYSALLSPGTEYSLVPKVDAYRLGYPEAARDDPVTEPPNLFRGVTFDGYWEGMLISLKEVTIGGASQSDVDFIAYDVPQMAGFDVVLGKSFLARSGVVIDFAASAVRINAKEGIR
ncbi:MAG: hypothetical protein JRM80_05635 [Nitrososphaerota archaeon]|nr:hypothetical protein [Nitrososphaerota archaeon]